MNKSTTWAKAPTERSESHCLRFTERERSAADAPPAVISRRQLGNQRLQRLLRARGLQAKLAVSDPNDVYEQEADRVADAVMRMQEPRVGIGQTAIPQVQRLCPECEDELKRQPIEEEELQAKPAIPSVNVQRQPLEEEEEPVQAKHQDKGSLTVSREIEEGVRALPGRGEPLPESIRSFMEPRFDTDFSAVRVHTDAQADHLARSVHARAFTVGRDIVFAAGQYRPETDQGRQLMAHELTHVVQQGGTGVRGSISRATGFVSVRRRRFCSGRPFVTARR